MPLNRLFLVCALLAFYLVTGCATGKDAVTTQGLNEDSLRSEAVRYWNARIDGDYETAYSIEDKEGLPAFADYRLEASSIRKHNVQNFSIERISIEGMRATLSLTFSVRLPASPKPFKSIIRDSWVYRDGAWQHLFTE
jgi:hypothetical protein